MVRYRTRVSQLLLALTILCSQLDAQQPTGIVTGRVIEPETREPLAGAIVSVQGSAIEVVTDRDGNYRLIGVPAGAQTLVVRYLGRRNQQVEIKLTAGETLTQLIEFDQPYAFEETVSVGANLQRDAQARALNLQKNALDVRNVISADQIGSFPDPNAAESLQRVPGVTITKDQGEGRYVSIRGTEPRLNSMMIDGERIPAPDPLLRQVALDVVPSELLQAIEVSKTLTPDMDGDAIGGSVNLVTKQAPEKWRLLGRVGGGYNKLMDNWDQNNYALTTGGRAGRLGGVFSLAGSETNRANNDVEVSYNDTLGIADLDPRYYEVIRRRVGTTAAVDVKGSGASLYTVRGVFNRFIDDHERRNRLRQRVGNRRIERERRDRTHIERIASGSFDGRSLLFGRSTFDFKFLGAYSDQTDPLTMTTTFRQSNVNFAPNVSAGSIDPDNIQANPLNQDINAFTFNQQIRATNYSKDFDIVGSANLRVPLRQGASSVSFLKTGVKLRDKNKGRTRNESTYTTSSTLRLTDFVLSGSTEPFLDGRYDLLPYMDQEKAARIPELVPTTAVRNHARDAEEFDGNENTTGAYVMAELYPSSRLTIVPGLRYEYTAADFTGRDVQFAANGTWVATLPLRSTHNYGVALPSAQLRFATTPDTNMRFAVTRSVARPNYYDTVPYRAVDALAATVALGNVDLQPTTSWNLDLMGEHYFKSVGVVSAGVFYKRLQDYIYVFTADQTIDGSIYHVTQPLNGDEATVRGVELVLQNQLTFLPGALKGLGVYANYTYTDSSAAIPGHEGSRLPGQSPHVGNLAASYEQFGFSGRVAVTFHGSYVDQIGASSLLDRYYDRASQLDLSLSQKVTRNFRVFADVLNMNDALLRYYQGVRARTLQEEHYSWWTNFGVRFEF